MQNRRASEGTKIGIWEKLKKDLMSGDFSPQPNTARYSSINCNSHTYLEAGEQSIYSPLTSYWLWTFWDGKDIIFRRLQANGFFLPNSIHNKKYPVVLLKGNLQVGADMNGTCNCFWMFYASRGVHFPIKWPRQWAEYMKLSISYIGQHAVDDCGSWETGNQ